jgi:hypothetical protein
MPYGLRELTKEEKSKKKKKKGVVAVEEDKHMSKVHITYGVISIIPL